MSNPARAILCPYCGHVQRGPAERCAECSGFFDAESLRSTQQHMGPWFIRDKQAPHRPGCSYAVLLKQVQRGKIKPDTILRGPTTRQFWSLARNTPGIAHHLGHCHACDADAAPTDQRCSACGVTFPHVTDRQSLGLDEVEIPVERPAISAAATGSVARATIVATTSLAPQPLASSHSPPPAASHPSPPPATSTDARFAAAMAAPVAETHAVDASPAAADSGGGGGGISPLAWVMIGINTVAILALAVVFILAALKPPVSAPDNRETTEAEPTAPTTATSTVSPAPAAPEPAPSAPSTATSTPVTVPPTAATPTTPSATPAETPSFFGIEIPQDAGVPQQQIDALNQRFAEINTLYRSGNLAEALAKLKQLQRSLPPGVRAEGLDAAIARLEKEHSDRELRNFFNAN